jgi:hypothetical protein
LKRSSTIAATVRDISQDKESVVTGFFMDNFNTAQTLCLTTFSINKYYARIAKAIIKTERLHSIVTC